MNAQLITSPTGERLIVLPESEYEILRAAAEDAADAGAVRMFRQRLEEGAEELIPDDVVTDILTGEHPVRVWRKHRGLSARELANAAGISQPYVSQIESGKRDGTVVAMKKIAEVLGVDLDDLV